MEPSAEATIVTLMPYLIKASKPTLDPGEFEVPPAPYDGINYLQVGISRYRPYFGAEYPAILVPELGQTVANSIVNDYINSIPAVVIGEAQPGLLVFRNKLSMDQCLQHKTLIEQARDKQEAWFWRLIVMADDAFPFQGHKSIMKMQREAAKAMGLKREWNEPDHRLIDKLIETGKVKPSATVS
jgi:hypothetical protein